jgi:diacylglycerol kinase (ATP)
MNDAARPDFLHIVLNPAAGAGAGRRVRAELERALRRRGAAFRIEETRAAGHAVDLAGLAAQAGAPVVVAAGGDGTINEVANGLLRARAGGATAVLGVVPVGTGNDFVKGVSGARPREAAYDTLLTGRARPVDAGRVVWSGGDVAFVNAMGTGIDVEVVRQMERLRGLPGGVVYALGLVRALRRFRPVRLRVTLDDGRVVDRPVMIAALSNGHCVGGAFRLSPDARNDDGRLDLCLVEAVGAVGVARLLPRVLRGTHGRDPAVHTARTTAATVEVEGGPLWFQIDGELRLHDAPDPVRVSIRQRVLPVLAAARAARDAPVPAHAGGSVAGA